MSLTAKDKAVVKAFWGKISKPDAIGQESVGSEETHGKSVMSSITDAVGKMDDLVGGMSALSNSHATQFRVDPGNFKILSHNILVTLAVNFPVDFTAEVHVAVDKFLAGVSAAVADKYR